ncbi:MAG: cobyric acid synthase CobQ [Candidatus Lambdaproteobacteria bacterium RIFOXYD2_FULL_50_16]|uniref:Cobyric acid synthase n=1 Tax=Candidatus Lambdaproteobacteria bacterium RIFOXYD2_FULL_50_16 TaxID=1817772 RepID=A0A1F6GB26_9PROT|nr:MAG: cobyric acid synthase CobQ [Candidatus Lambdaproteobacteria bacterium RIFOXYD2_FULL_50_16]
MTSLAILGTGSDVGKSLVTALILRLLKDRGIQAAPFKAQNMSNNSAVTSEGLEIGRAQWMQATAAGLLPEVLMNPVLVKPQADHSSQLVVMGRPVGQLVRERYFERAEELKAQAYSAFRTLREKYPNIVVEGAGSLAEVNLRHRDYINLGLAREFNIPVILVADIDRGGVFAQIVGSLEIISPEDRALIKGILINRFRGSALLFQDGIDWIEKRTGLPVLGLLPYRKDLKLPAEDAVVLDQLVEPHRPTGPAIAVIAYPRISNFTDFDPLQNIPGIELHYLRKPRNLSDYSLVVLPGSKAVVADLDWLRGEGWLEEIESYRRDGGKILGVCGGFQMMGQRIEDPLGVESDQPFAQGLGLIPMVTVFSAHKVLKQKGPAYEIHQGQSHFLSDHQPWLGDGWRGDEGWGSYQHGLFEDQIFLAQFLKQALGLDLELPAQSDPYQNLAEALGPHLDLDRLIQIMEAGA